MRVSKEKLTLIGMIILVGLLSNLWETENPVIRPPRAYSYYPPECDCMAEEMAFYSAEAVWMDAENEVSDTEAQIAFLQEEIERVQFDLDDPALGWRSFQSYHEEYYYMLDPEMSDTVTEDPSTWTNEQVEFFDEYAHGDYLAENMSVVDLDEMELEDLRSAIQQTVDSAMMMVMQLEGEIAMFQGELASAQTLLVQQQDEAEDAEIDYNIASDAWDDCLNEL